MRTRALCFLLCACTSAASPAPVAPSAAPVAPHAAPGGCPARLVRGVILDASSGEPIDRIQVSLAGGEGQDDATTDHDGRFALRSTAPGRDRLVVFYAGDSIVRPLDATRCDEEIRLRVGARARAPAIM